MANDAAQRSEKPTPKKLRDARRKGQIPRSPDLVGWFVVLVSTFVLPSIMSGLRTAMTDYFATIRLAIIADDLTLAMTEANSLAGTILLTFIPFLLVVALVTAGGLMIQGGVTITAEPLRPKLERISPKAGIKRLVSAQSAVDTAKAVFRLVVLIILVVQITTDQVNSLLVGTTRSLEPAGVELGEGLLLLVRLAAIIGLVVGFADYAFQRYKVGKQLRMSKHEVKQENKNTDGDPMIRGRRRQMHAKVSRNQMLAAVGESSVVVVNPTHVAVALAYSSGGVPTVVAKGGDELARRIRERAFDSGVPVVEARPLARVLHDNIEVGEEVPAALYEAVAVVIAFVMRSPKVALDRMVRRVSVPLSAMPNPHFNDDPADEES